MESAPISGLQISYNDGFQNIPCRRNELPDIAIDEAVERTVERMTARMKIGPQGDAGPAGPPGPPSNDTAASKDRWNPAELGYFDPQLDKSYPKGDIISVNKETWIRDVHLFVARVKDLVNLKGAPVVQNNPNTALRGAAQDWYIAELNDLERGALRDDRGNKAELWIFTLVKRFKEQNQVYNQLIFAHEHIEPELRFMVDPPTEDTSAAQYIQALDIKKSSWFALHSHTAPTVQTRQQPYPLQPQGPRPQNDGFHTGNNPFRSFQQQQSPYWPQLTNVAFQRPNQQPNYQQRPQQFMPQSFSRNLFTQGVSYPSQQVIAPAAAPTPSTRSYNNQLVPYNSSAAQGVPAIKDKKGKDQGYNSQGRPWENREGYKPRTSAYQGSTSKSQDQDQETGAAGIADVSFAD